MLNAWNRNVFRTWEKAIDDRYNDEISGGITVGCKSFEPVQDISEFLEFCTPKRGVSANGQNIYKLKNSQRAVIAG